ncbi:MAG: lytic transglycosylase [Gammaproteobacteria bacterium RIFCSPHIGHO2_12_FULL_35_23]|nr:MAG: lytic transglycosylase [Gammaproteobacteria bacterium RIFCSPHIGHO2_12_FULL_35_23]
MKGCIRLFILILCFFTSILYADIPSQTQSWTSWVADLREQALSEGVRPELFDQLFANMEPGKVQLNLKKTQPERRLTFLEYRKTRIDPYRIKIGQNKFQANNQLFTDLGDSYQVDPCFVAAIWGIETSYGNYLGSFSVIHSLATLAYGSDRYEFYRQELLDALQILNEGHVSIADFKGEWAGASGHGQFLPSSWFKYAVDYDNDGKKDIWKSLPDALASIANYLQQNGWQAGQPWGIAVNLPDNFDQGLIGLSIQKPISYWTQLGVEPQPGYQLPTQDLEASVIYPDGGPAFLVFNNFRVLLRYNNSTYYAASVAYLADQICRR